MTRVWFLLAVAYIVWDASYAAGAPQCKPILTVKGVTFSPVHQWRRTWNAHIVADASHCSTTAGHFDIDFMRLREDAPDLRFSEQFTWTVGELDATTVFAADEAVLQYSIRAAACPCRK
jgi:hypothetical protein